MACLGMGPHPSLFSVSRAVLSLYRHHCSSQGENSLIKAKGSFGLQNQVQVFRRQFVAVSAWLIIRDIFFESAG